VLDLLAVAPMALALMPRMAVAEGGKVRVKVRVVHATNAHSRVDERLTKIARHLRNLRYSGFELIETETADLAKGAKRSFTIAGGRKMTVNLISKDSKRAKLRVQIHGKRGKLLDTTVSVRRNGFFIVAGPRYKDGILVLPISARY
jgi:hypothetical protein